MTGWVGWPSWPIFLQLLPDADDLGGISRPELPVWKNALTAMAIHLGEKNVPSAVDERLKVGKKKIAG